MRVVIIGAIAAGMSAAAKLRRVDKEAEIIVFEKQEYVSFGACGLPYYVGDYFDDANRMLVRTPDQIRGMGIELHLRHEVTSVDAKEKQVVVKDLERTQNGWFLMTALWLPQEQVRLFHQSRTKPLQMCICFVH